MTNKKRYKYKHKTLSIPLFEIDNIILYDCLVSDINSDIDTFHIYSKLRFNRIPIISFPICYSFTDTKCEEAVKSRMIEIMNKDPHISSYKLRKITGHCSASIIRHYMILKRRMKFGNNDQ